MNRLDASLIRDLSPFAGMDIDAMQRLLDQAQSLHHEKGATIYREGEEATSFYFLLDGHIRVVKINQNGEQMIARYISPNELYGIAKALGRSKYPASAVAASDCLSLAWPTRIWDDVMARYPSFAESSNHTVGDRFIEAQDRIMELTTAKVEQRVANAILKLAHQTGKKIDDGILIDFPISRQDISEITGTTLHTVSRIMSAWEEKGWVRSGRQKIVLVEGHKLAMLATAAKT